MQLFLISKIARLLCKGIEIVDDECGMYGLVLGYLTVVPAAQKLYVLLEDIVHYLEHSLDVLLVGVVKIRRHQRHISVIRESAAEVENE